MKRQLAFVLGGGGARGALQVGALRALLEAGYQPDILVGTSIGAVNASFIALNGINLESLDRLVAAWKDTLTANLLPANYLWLTVRVLFNRPVKTHANRMQEFFTAHGLAPEIRFEDIQGVRLAVVAADLNSGCPRLFGLDPTQSVLEGVLASTALPPWVSPLQKDGKLLIDGGVVSCLPIEPALALGASEIIALDLFDPRSAPAEVSNFGHFFTKLLMTVEQRQIEVETALASARGVPVRHVTLRSEQPIALWDFSRSLELIERGYEITRQEITGWQSERQIGWRKWLFWR